MANELFKLMGEISVNSQAALNAIDNVLKAAQGLYNYINNNSGTIKVTTGTSTTVIDQVLQDVKKLYNHINNNAGKINAENSTALSKISAVSTAATDVYNLINTKTGTVNIDTSGATQKIAALQESAQSVAGYLGSGSSTTGSTGAGSALAGALGKGTTQSGTGAIDWSWWNNGFADIAAWGNKFLSQANTAVNAFAVAGVAKTVNEIGDFFQTGYEYNTFKESGIAKLKTLLQTTPEDATAFFGELEQFAIDSPLTMEGVLESAIKMLGIGVDRGDLISTMQMLGDLALGDSNTMSRTAKALSDVMANTRLLAQEGRQFTETGVPVWRLMEEYYATQEGHKYKGLNAGELKAMNKVESPIPYEDVLAALQMATSPEGMFYDAINVMMGTTEGKAEKMQDAYRRTAGSLAEAFVSVFSSQTIPAMNEILQQLDEWADENPEVLDNLASAFNNLATFGLKAFTASLEELATFWSTNRETIDSMLVLIGGMLFTAHPAVGTALIAAGGGDLYMNTKENTMVGEIEKTNKTGEFTLGSALMPDDIEGKMADGATYDDLSDEERERYDKASFWRTAFAVLDNDLTHMMGFGNETFGEKQIKTVDPSKYGIDIPATEPEEVAEKDAEKWYDGLADWFVFDNNTQKRKFGTPSIDFDGLGGSNGNVGMLAALLQQLSTLKPDVTAAVKEGVTEGVSGITINGYVTTGDVKLQDGTIVGALTPYIDLKLGQLESQSNWG